MKKVVKCSVLLLVALMMVGVASTVFAQGTSNVRNTKHNMSAGASVVNPWYFTDETEVCIFCHTPHGGSLTGPLWNRADPTPAGGWQFYDSSTVSTTVKNVAAISPESLMCLSCHDGSVSVNHLLNYGATNPIYTDANGQDNTTITAGPPRIGGNPANPGDQGQLGDDHPISFSYNDVYTERGGLGLKDATTMSADIRFFGGVAVRRVECSTCHDPHVDYNAEPQYTPFLNMSNAASALCTECHDK